MSIQLNKIKAFFLSSLFFLCFEVFSQKTADQLLNEGISFYQKGELNNAILSFSDVIKQDKKNVNGYYFRGQMYIINKNYNEAIIDFKSVIKLRDTLYQAYHYLAACYFNINDTTEAIKYEDKCLSINPHFFDALQTKASYLIVKNKFSDAEKLVDECLIIKPDNAETYYYKGECIFGNNNFKDALFYFEKSYDGGYNSDLLFNKLAICYLKQNDLSKALARINQAIDIAPSIGYHYLNRGIIYYNMKFNSTALKDLEKARALKATFTKEQQDIYNKLKA